MAIPMLAVLVTWTAPQPVRALPAVMAKRVPNSRPVMMVIRMLAVVVMRIARMPVRVLPVVMAKHVPS